MTCATDNDRPQPVSLPEPLGKVRDAVELLGKATTEHLSQIIAHLKKMQRDRVEKLRLEYESARETLGWPESQHSSMSQKGDTHFDDGGSVSAPLPDPVGLVSNVVRLFNDVTNEQLAEIRVHLKNELQKRKDNAESECKSLEDAINLLDPIPDARSSKSSSTSKTTRKKSTTKQAKGKANGSGRARRGESTGTILASLKDGPKTKEQILEHFKTIGLDSGSVPSLLSRLKKEKKVAYTEENKQWSLSAGAIE